MEGETILRRDLPHQSRLSVSTKSQEQPAALHQGSRSIAQDDRKLLGEDATRPSSGTRWLRVCWHSAARFIGLALLVGIHAGLTLTWLQTKHEMPLSDRLMLSFELAISGGARASDRAVTFSEAIVSWTNEAPLLQGNHALQWYQARLGITPWHNCAWDPCVYGGYLVTPWWNASGRLAALWMLVEPSWRAYKLGLLLTVCLLPLLWWRAARMLGAERISAGVSALLCIAAFWSGPGICALNSGELDQIIASGIVPLLVGSWCLWQNQHHVTAAGWATVSLILLGWAYPLAGIVHFLVGVIWYLWRGARQSAWWQLSTASLALLVAASYYPTIRAACQTWWLMDGRWPEDYHSFWARIPVLRQSQWLGLAAMSGSALLGIWRCQDRSVARIALLTLGVCILAGTCPALPCPRDWQPARCIEFLWPTLLIFGVRGAFCPVSAKASTPEDTSPPDRPAARWLAWILSFGVLSSLGYAVLGSDLLPCLWNLEAPSSALGQAQGKFSRVEQQNFDAQFRLLTEWLGQYTTLEAAIAVEEDEELLTWSPCLVAGSGRMFVNGLAREVPWAFSGFRLRQEVTGGSRSVLPELTPAGQNMFPCLNRRPLDRWSQEELRELLDRWNVGWLLVRRPEAAARFLRLPDTQLVVQDGQSGWRLLARKAPGYFVQGQGRLLRLEPGSLTLADLTPAPDTCVLRLVYVPGLSTSCHLCRIEPAALAGTVFPCWSVVCPGPQTRLTVRYQGGADGAR